MSNNHVVVIEKKVTELSNALATLGRGTSLAELIKIIRFPGFTTPAEFALIAAVLDGMSAHVTALAKMENDLLAGSKLIVEEGASAAKR